MKVRLEQSAQTTQILVILTGFGGKTLKRVVRTFFTNRDMIMEKFLRFVQKV